jgi:hypothetical protein
VRQLVPKYSCFRKFSESAASTKSSPFASKPAQANKSGCGSSDAQIAAPVIVRGLEDKAIEDLKDMHVEAVDEEDKPFAWKNPTTGMYFWA